MGIFSLFKRKNDRADAFDAAAEARVRAADPGRPTAPAPTEAERARQRELARATAAKIDAIESAMAFDIFNTPEPAWSGPRRNSRAADGASSSTLPMLDMATTELLADDELPEAAAVPDTAPVVEEIAILFANDQLVVAEQMLIDSLGELGQSERAVWWMLFDLYQITGKQDDFDNIAIDYASRFETSPPTWAPLAAAGPRLAGYAGVTPTEAFKGLLDESITPQLARLAAASSTGAAVLRLEVGRVQAVTPAGCALLLATLQALRGAGRELIVAGAAELAVIVRASIAIGERDASEAPWLLLLELLQLLHREKDFEETAMDYCVTYEVSPPSFEAAAGVATPASPRAPAAVDRFLLPAVIDGATTPLFDAIDAFAAGVDAVVFDCSRLARVDYSAAAALRERVRLLAAHDKRIEFRDLNHLVAALFKLLAFNDVARLFPHKY